MRIFVLLSTILFMFVTQVSAFEQLAANKDQRRCTDCHTLNMDEAKDVLAGLQGEVVHVKPAVASGFWEIGIKTGGQTVPVFLDYSKKYLFSGNLVRLADRKNLSEDSFRRLNPVDVSKIPTDDALPLGNPEASTKIIVFTDPHCPYCAKLHEVMKEAVAKRSDLLFLIKLMPIKPSSKTVSKSIVCNQSMEQLEAAFAKLPVPEASCENNAIEQTLAVAKSFGINSTPTLILPNGQVAPGYKPLEALLEMIDLAINKN